MASDKDAVAHVSEWVAYGLITPEQGEAILRHEQVRHGEPVPAPGPAPSAAPAPTPAVATPAEAPEATPTDRDVVGRASPFIGDLSVVAGGIALGGGAVVAAIATRGTGSTALLALAVTGLAFGLAGGLVPRGTRLELLGDIFLFASVVPLVPLAMAEASGLLLQFQVLGVGVAAWATMRGFRRSSLVTAALVAGCLLVLLLVGRAFPGGLLRLTAVGVFLVAAAALAIAERLLLPTARVLPVAVPLAFLSGSFLLPVAGWGPDLGFADRLRPAAIALLPFLPYGLLVQHRGTVVAALVLLAALGVIWVYGYTGGYVAPGLLAAGVIGALAASAPILRRLLVNPGTQPKPTEGG